MKARVCIALVFLCYLSFAKTIHYTPNRYVSAVAEPQIAATPTSFSNVREKITVTWSGVVNPHSNDTVSVVAPSLKKDYKYHFVNKRVDHCKTWKDGHGSFEFDLLNMRLDYEFRYYSYINGEHIHLMSSNLVTVDVSVPLHGHTALTGKSGEIEVMWTSGTTKTPTVKYGSSPNLLSLFVNGSSTSYTLDSMCSDSKGGEWAAEYYIPPGHIHRATITGLQPGQPYYYQFGDGGQNMSPVFSVLGPNFALDEINFIAFGDSGTSLCQEMNGWCEPPAYNTYTYIGDEISNKTYNFLLHIGDISYAVGHAHRWEQFMYQIEPVATALPYMVGIGNHETDYNGQDFQPSWSDIGEDSHGECGIPFNTRFHMPENGNGNLWFSFEYGPAHFTFMSTEHNSSVGSPQHEWIVNDLASVDRNKTPWIIFSGHRPMYTSTVNTTENYTWLMSNYLKESLEELLLKYQVDVGFWGHVHNYERTCPLFNRECLGDYEDPKAPVHFVIGMAGQSLSPEFPKYPPEWSLFRAPDFGFSRVRITRTEFHLEYVGDDGQTVHDYAILKKK